MKDNKLEVDDVVYCWHHGYPGYYSKHKIIRLTPQRAVLDNGNQVKNILHLNNFDKTELRANGIGSCSDAILANGILDGRYQEQQLRRKAKAVSQSIDISKLSIEQCRALIELFPEAVKEG